MKFYQNLFHHLLEKIYEINKWYDQLKQIHQIISIKTKSKDTWKDKKITNTTSPTINTRNRNDLINDEYIENPTNLYGIDDLSKLIYSNISNISFIIYNLEYRYNKLNKYHTSIKNLNALISINRYKQLSIYNNQSKKINLKTIVHPYDVAANAIRQMIEYEINQSIVILGEEGSGKVCFIPFRI